MKSQAINNFMFESVLIEPITDIISKLENKSFRVCDIKWLNTKLSKYTSFALETLNKSFEIDDMVGGYVSGDFTTMNNYVNDRFLKSFNILLKYFKSFE